MLDRFSHYLRSNQAPSEHEAHEIKALKVNPLEEISRIDVEIERLESTLDSLKRQRASIQKSIDDCNAILSPIRHISADVWGVIFAHCLTTHRNPIMDGSEAPMLLTRICRDWRSFALSDPRLWSRFHVPLLPTTIPESRFWDETRIPHDGELRLEARSEEVQRWLKLSGAYPLSITISIPTASNLHQAPLDAIIQSSRRWQELELGSFRFHLDVWQRIVSLSVDDLCMLRELRVHSMDGSEDPMWSERGLIAAPGLRSISIGQLRNIDVFHEGIPSNWQNLNHLSIHCPIPVGLAEQLLAHCCNLVSCVIEISSESAYHPIPFSSFGLPRLGCLSLKGDPTICNQLFRKIEAQSLRIFHFSSSIESSGLFHFLQSINSLRTLMIDYNITEDNPLKCGTLTPAVTRLVLGSPIPTHQYSYPSPTFRRWRSNTPDFMTVLYKIKHQYSPHSAPTILFPSLEVLEAYDIEMTDATLLELIIARVDATRLDTTISKLRKVLIQFSRPREIDIVPEALAYAQAAGIELELKLMYLAGPFHPEWSPSFGLVGDGPSWTYSTYFDM